MSLQQWLWVVFLFLDPSYLVKPVHRTTDVSLYAIGDVVSRDSGETVSIIRGLKKTFKMLRGPYFSPMGRTKINTGMYCIILSWQTLILLHQLLIFFKNIQNSNRSLCQFDLLGCIQAKSGDPVKTPVYSLIWRRLICFGCGGPSCSGWQNKTQPAAAKRVENFGRTSVALPQPNM